MNPTQKKVLFSVLVVAIVVFTTVAFLTTQTSQDLLGIRLNGLSGMAYNPNRSVLIENDIPIRKTVPPTPTKPPIKTGFIVTSPAAKVIWGLGEKHAITWSGVQGGTVTITLDKPAPACLSAKPPCAIMQMDSFLIAQNVPNSGSFSWTIPTSLPSGYLGDGYITVTMNDTNLFAQSGTFTLQKGSSDSTTNIPKKTPLPKQSPSVQ